MSIEDEVRAAVERLTVHEKRDLVALLSECNDRTKYRTIDKFFPLSGEFSYKHYKKQVEFMNAGSKYSERILFGGNRSGKSYCAGYEMACHLTGEYPPWWKGRRFYGPILAWAAGTSGKKTVESIQQILLGSNSDIGSGLIPKANLLNDQGELMVTTSPGLVGGKQDAFVRHASGGYSQITFKSFEQKREAFEANAVHVIWLDEEAPVDIYTECLTRTMTTKGIIMLTFTPLKSLTELVLQFLKDGQFPQTESNCGPVSESKWVSRVEWDDVPHLTDEDKAKLLDSYLPHEREARSKGIPAVGQGKVYQVDESQFVIPPFEIPPHWPRAIGLDVGWKTTAAVWMAYDEANDCAYIYKEYKVEHQLPIVHAHVLKGKEPWIPIVVDPAASSLRIKKDGPSMLREYNEMGLEMYKANNSVDVGILNVLNRLSTSRLKVFMNCPLLLNEYRIYGRNDRQEIIKRFDDLMDALRYVIMSGIPIAITKPDDDDDRAEELRRNLLKQQGKNSITGY